MEHTFDYTVILFSPSATPISRLCLLTASADFSQFVVYYGISPPVRPHGISLPVFPRLPCLIYAYGVTVAFWTSLSAVSFPPMYALYQVSVRQATISLSLLLAHTSRCKTLGVAMGFVDKLRPYGLSPQTDGMPVIPQKKIAAAMRCNLPISHIVRLILCFFDFRYLPCCCGYNPYAFIAHTVQQRVKLPPPGGFLRIAVREEKLIYRNMIPGYKV